MSNKGLYEKLIEYSENGKYPLHMPGHKRKVKLFKQVKISTDQIDPYEIDITEINDFDNLHHPEGIIKSSMENAAKFFGTDRTWFLINGSSCGLLAAINAVTDIGDSIIIGRNCHKAVYHAMELRNLKAHYLYPQMIQEYGINGGYEPEDVETILRQAEVHEEKIKAVVLTSPTYEGVVSDIKRIAEIAHKYNSVLIVDEAHGAHLGIHENLPKPAYMFGADIVIESAHKTLPAMTQTAFLHLCGKRVDANSIQDCLSIYQSSSPSYVLMASLDKCIRALQANGKDKLYKLLITLEKFRKKVSKLENIKVPGKEFIGKNGVFDYDVCKLVIFVSSDKFNGKKLEKILREKYNFELEMTSARYVLAMTTMCDDMEQIMKLADSLEEIDKEITVLEQWEKDNQKTDMLKLREEKKTETGIQKGTSVDYLELRGENPSKVSIYEAKRRMAEEMPLNETGGRVAAEYVYVYPPEIPLIVPGEFISKKVIEQIQYYKNIGLNVKGIEQEKMKVLAEEL